MYCWTLFQIEKWLWTPGAFVGTSPTWINQDSSACILYLDCEAEAWSLHRNERWPLLWLTDTSGFRMLKLWNTSWANSPIHLTNSLRCNLSGKYPWWGVPRLLYSEFFLLYSDLSFDVSIPFLFFPAIVELQVSPIFLPFSDFTLLWTLANIRA